MSKTIVGAVLSAALLFAQPLHAQTPVPAEAVPAPAAKVSIPGGVFYKGLQSQQYAAKDRLIGANVVNKDGVIIGDIKDLILNSGNEVDGVIIGTGGILGAGEKEVGVRYQALNFSRKDGKLVITLPEGSKDVMAALAAFEHTGKKSLSEKATDKAKALIEKTKTGAGPALEKAKAATSSAVEQAKAAAGPALEKAKAATGAAVDKAKEVGGAAMEKAKEGVDAAKDKAATTTTPKQ